ncbi:hypothetical protein AVEN_143961-1 [Araneus ventricosus]|uniref:Uncharacterized protein n=1 Tax=Araneus ventricosus TaxID=182803 RepID=A0A4Y2RYS3_ARAVE|nr:hypothetical protein AVEN_143961-1 [Araneus ventricosus]
MAVRSNRQTDVQTCSQGACDNHKSVPAVIGKCSPDHNSRCRSSVSRTQTCWLQALTWPPSNQHTAITGTKAEPAFIRKHNRSPRRPPMSSLRLISTINNAHELYSAHSKQT